MPVEVECDWCGKTFVVIPSRADSARFCSQECTNKWLSEERQGNKYAKGKKKEGKIEIECEACGKEFEVRKERENTARYCSNECKSKAYSERFKGEENNLYKEKIETECADCGERLELNASRIREHNFCSRECFIDFLSKKRKGKDNPNYTEKVEVRCQSCGEKLKVYPREVSETLGNFCSRECFAEGLSKAREGENNPSWRGGNPPYYGSSWMRQRRRALERDNHICQLCGAEEDGKEHSVHHIVPFREFGRENYKEANKLSNLITLCTSCHNRAEYGKIPKKRLKNLAGA